MATTRNRRAKASPPVEVKPVEAPQAEEVKEAPKPVEKKVAAPQAKQALKAPEPQVEEVKEAPKPVEKKVEKSLPKIIELKSIVSGSRGVGEVIIVDKVDGDEGADLITVKTETGQYRARRKNLVLV